MKYEFGVLNIKTRKMHREGMSEEQVESLISVHLSDCGTDTPIWLVKVRRIIGDWE